MALKQLSGCNPSRVENVLKTTTVSGIAYAAFFVDVSTENVWMQDFLHLVESV